MKSHDCHVFFQRLLPWAFKALPKHIWSILTEFSMFFREICASELNVEKLRHLEASIPITLCKLEMVFPPSMFDSMEHLPVHLAYEEIVGGLQQYKWMYPFERFLRTLKKNIKNPKYVEGSIAEAFLVEEATKFASYYYPLEMISRWRGVPRNDDGVTSLTGSDRQILRCQIPKLSNSRTLSFLNGFDPTSWKTHQIAMKLRGVYLMELQ
ncbi:hypothetical protein K1719_028034 [Acacia pycnantha]|nr:hypothetical protein K1719_028034 [Acacia pycnantha]